VLHLSFLTLLTPTCLSIYLLQTRERLTKALQNRDLLKSIGEYEEHQPVEARPIREMRAVFECLGGEGHHLGPARKKEPSSLSAAFGIPANRVVRTEKVGSGGYSSLIKKPLRTGFAQIDSYGESRKDIAFKSIDGYYRRIKAERKKKAEKNKSFDEETSRDDEADAAARDAVRCLEHAMVVVAGEKNVYRAIVAPSLVQSNDEDAIRISPFYRKACVAAYSHVVAAVVDRTMDIIETVFLKEGGIGQSSGGEKEGGSSTGLTVRAAASAAAAGLRMLDGVRMLGPSLAKLCDMPIEDGKDGEVKTSSSNMSVASTLCIAIHRTTVKNCAKTLENLAKAIQEDPNNGPKHRPPDSRLATVTSDVVRAVRLISPFVSAYKSVTKRRALPWDPNIGDEAGEMDSYVRFLIMRLLNSLQGKALNYTKNAEDEGGQAKSNMFMINNTFYLLQQLTPKDSKEVTDVEVYHLDGEWFKEKVNTIFQSERGKYMAHWELINSHLTAVDSTGLEYQKNKNILSLESGRMFKDRFKGFNDDFGRMYDIHHPLSVIDNGLRKELQSAVKDVFMKRYEKFYEKYSRFRFSKKNQNEYLKYPPPKVDSMLSRMYGGNLTATKEDAFATY
jgi:exocyst complex protein 7